MWSPEHGPQDVDARTWSLGRSHQDVVTRTWIPGRRRQDTATRMSPPWCSHQNTGCQDMAHGHQDMAARMSPLRCGHQNTGRQDTATRTRPLGRGRQEKQLICRNVFLVKAKFDGQTISYLKYGWVSRPFNNKNNENIRISPMVHCKKRLEEGGLFVTKK